MTDTEIYGVDYDSKGNLSSSGDIGLVSELSNAEQAIRNRLLTRLETYPSIDNEYGSEVYRVLGERITADLISELRVYINNCLLEEPRVYEVIDLDITPVGHDGLRVDLQVQLVDGSELGFEEIINTLG